MTYRLMAEWATGCRKAAKLSNTSPLHHGGMYAVARSKESTEHTLKRIIRFPRATRIGGLSAWRSHAGVAE